MIAAPRADVCPNRDGAEPPLGFVRCRERGTVPRLASSCCRRGAPSGAVAFVAPWRQGRPLTSLSTCSATSQHLSRGPIRGFAGETSGSRQTWRQRERRCWMHGPAAFTNASKSHAEVGMVEQGRPSLASRCSTGFLHQRPSSTSASTTTAARWRRRGSVVSSLASTHRCHSALSTTSASAAGFAYVVDVVGPKYLESRSGLLLFVDTNLIGSHDAEVRELVRLHEEGWIQLQRTDTVDTELGSKGDPDRRKELLAESAGFVESLGAFVLDHSRLDHAVLGGSTSRASTTSSRRCFRTPSERGTISEMPCTSRHR